MVLYFGFLHIMKNNTQSNRLRQAQGTVKALERALGCSTRLLQYIADQGYHPELAKDSDPSLHTRIDLLEKRIDELEKENSELRQRVLEKENVDDLSFSFLDPSYFKELRRTGVGIDELDVCSILPDMECMRGKLKNSVTRLKNAFHYQGITTIGDLKKSTLEAFQLQTNVGRTVLFVLIASMRHHKIVFGR